MSMRKTEKGTKKFTKEEKLKILIGEKNYKSKRKNELLKKKYPELRKKQ